MAILIPNIDMPKSCSDCPLEYDCFVCRLTDTDFCDNEYEEDWCETRMPDCPLIEIPDDAVKKMAIVDPVRIFTELGVSTQNDDGTYKHLLDMFAEAVEKIDERND